MDNHNAGLQKRTPAKVPRLYHKKSRHGCSRCRARKVKCDEGTPICGSCTRHGVACVYPKRPLPSSAKPPSPSPHSRSVSPEVPDQENQLGAVEEANDILLNGDMASVEGVPDMPESTSRRLLELHLLHHFITQVVPTMPASHRPLVSMTWFNDVPKIANRSPPLLNAVLSISALHLSHAHPKDHDLTAAYRTYLDLTLRAYRKVLSTLDAKTADAASFTSALIFIDAYAALQYRPIPSPYKPPMQWLHISNSAWNIFHIASAWTRDDPDAACNNIIRSAPGLANASTLFSSNHGQHFRDHILPIGQHDASEHAEDAELRDPETKEAYEKSITYLGSVHATIKSRDDVYEVCRWLLAFAVMVPRKMIYLIGDQRPRALVVLAHYFCLVAALDGAIEEVWWVGKIGRREVDAIHKALPEEWKPRVRWPMEQVGLMARDVNMADANNIMADG